MVKRYLISFLSYAISLLVVAISAASESAVKMVAEFDKPVMASIEMVCQIGHQIKTTYTKLIGSGSAGIKTCYGFVSLRMSLDASALA